MKTMTLTRSAATKLIKALVLTTFAVSGPVALADDACVTPNQLARGARLLELQTMEVDELWKQIAPGSDASEIAEELADDAMDFREDIGREECDDLVEQFEEVQDGIADLEAAVRSDAQLRRRIDVLRAIAEVKRLAGNVARQLSQL